MKQIIALAFIAVLSVAASIRSIPLRKSEGILTGEFDDAKIIRMSSSLWIQSKNQNISLLHVPDVYQATDYTCGPSSLTAVLSFYGKEYREMDLANLAKTDPEVGTMPQALYRAITSIGISAKIHENLTLSNLQEYLEAHRPVIVLIQAWKDENDTTPYPNDFEDGHYVVAIGYDKKNFFFEDPWIHGSLTYMRKQDLFDRWHGNTNEPYDRHVYGSGIVVLQPPHNIQPVIYLQ